MTYDRHNFESDYLCPNCGELLYTDSSEPPRDVCLNSECELWPCELLSISDASEEREPQLYRELLAKETALIAEIGRWDPSMLPRYTYKARKELITMAISQGVMPSLDYWFAIGELLLMINKHPPSGTINNPEKFGNLLEYTRKWGRDQRNLEDLLTKRYCFGHTTTGQVFFVLKYSEAFAESHRSLGLLTHEDDVGGPDVFPYSHFEDTASPDVELRAVSEMTEWVETFWPLSLQLRYAFRVTDRTSKQYDYRPHAVDMSVLAGWFLRLFGKDDTLLRKSGDYAEALKPHFDEHGGGHRSAADFLNDYVDSVDLVPITVRTPDGLLMDRLTLIYFLIYLHGCQQAPNTSIGAPNDPILNRIRAQLGHKFEDWLRMEVHKRTYTGPDQAERVHYRGQEYEYDILAISEEKRRIILGDAKYRDMAPSSFTGTNLINQELLGKGALRDEANRQQLRLEFFQKNQQVFSRYLNPQHPWEQYEIRSYIITKHVPLAHRYKASHIVRAIEFLESEV